LKRPPRSTTRGVFVVDKAGKVLAAEPGGPAATVEVVKKLVGSTSAPVSEETSKAIDSEKKAEEPKAEEAKPATNGVNGSATAEDVAKANVAMDVADTAEKLDSKEAQPV
jgi:peroxiredoxin Q/BCP